MKISNVFFFDNSGIVQLDDVLSTRGSNPGGNAPISRVAVSVEALGNLVTARASDDTVVAGYSFGIWSGEKLVRTVETGKAGKVDLGTISPALEYGEYGVTACAVDGKGGRSPVSAPVVACYLPEPAAMTLRFEFSKKGYSPVDAGVGSAGTWTKVDSTTLNIWDWTNEATDWSEAFKGAFPDADNEVRVIAAGDTSSVTKMDKLFAGVYVNKPNGSTYAVTERNNVIKCVAFDVSNISKMNYMFTASNLKSVVHFDFSNNNSNCECDFLFADTLIEEVGDMSFKVKWLEGVFSRCNLLKKVGIITIDKNVYSSTSNLSLFTRCGNLEEVGGVSGTSNHKKFTNLFASCKKLKIIKNPIDCSSATDTTAMFNLCYALEKIPVLTNLGNSNVTTIYSMFSNCRALTEIPLFDTSHVTDARYMFSNCFALTEIPDYDFSSVTKVDYFCADSRSVKSGIFETYNKFLDRGASITSHTGCFLNCGIDTEEGRAALAQIPTSWGGLKEE